MFVVYTAGPYRSAQGMHGVAQNIERAGSVARQLWAMGFTVICPHKNTAFFDGADIPDEVWLAGCLQLVGRADILILLPGWEHSSGTRIERDTALALGIPIFEWDAPDTVSLLQRIASGDTLSAPQQEHALCDQHLHATLDAYRREVERLRAVLIQSGVEGAVHA